MSQPVESKASPELIAVWLDRYRRLGVLIEQQCDDPWSWVWSVRRRILGYLLRRYGSQVSARDVMSAPAPDPSQDTTSLATAPRPVRAPGVEAARDADVPLRGASSFRAKLEELRELNESGLASLAEQCRVRPGASARVVCLSYPESGYALPDEDILRQERALILQELDAIVELIPGDRPLSEDQIVAILSGDMA